MAPSGATARVASQTGTDPWAKAGVMIRESLAPGSRHAMVVVTPGNGAAYQCRLTPGASSLHTAGPGLAAPAWVRIRRQGDVFIGSVSVDGQAWTEITRRTIAMPTDVLVGLAVTSHANATAETAVFTDVARAP